MNGRAEVKRLQQRLDSAFSRIESVQLEPELQADFAKYLCVLVSGYLEKAVAEFLVEHARNCGGPTLHSFVESKTKWFTGAKTSRLIELLNDFDSNWGHRLDEFLTADLKDAVNSVVALRHQIVHGKSVDLTYGRISDYYGSVKRVVDEIGNICVPSG